MAWRSKRDTRGDSIRVETFERPEAIGAVHARATDGQHSIESVRPFERETDARWAAEHFLRHAHLNTEPANYAATTIAHLNARLASAHAQFRFVS